jgi:hypothetical protein
MTIYKLSIGWMIQYNFHNSNTFLCIKNTSPYLATAVEYWGDKTFLEERQVEYHTLPEHIKVSLAATQSTLSELEHQNSLRLKATINKIKGEQNGD